MTLQNRSPAEAGRDWSAVRLTLVRTEIKRRTRRLDYFGAVLMCEPAWDILLHAYSFELSHRRVSEADLLRQSHMPSTTTIRWMKVLEADGLIDRAVDDGNTTQVKITLTVKGLDALNGYFSEAP